MKKRVATSVSNVSNGSEKKLSLGKNMMWNSVGSLVYVFCNWVITVLVVILAPNYSASGSLAVAMAVGNVIATIVLFKVRPVQVSDMSSSYSAGDYICLRFVSVIIAVLFGLCYSAVTVSPSDYFPVLAYALFKVCDSFVDVYHGIDQRHDRLDYVGISQILRGVLIVACFAMGMMFTGSLTLSIAFMAFSTFAVVVAYDLPRARQFESLRPRFCWKNIRLLFGACLPGFLASLLCTFVVSLSRQVYGIEGGNELLGIYAAVATPAVIVQALASYIYAPLLGPIAHSWMEGDFGKIRNIIMRFVSLLVAIVIVCVVVFDLFGARLLAIVYGQGIASYSWLMLPILVCTALTAAMLFALDLLVVFRNYLGAIVSSIVSLLCCTMSIHALIEIFGMNGISYSISISYVLGIAVASLFIGMNIVKRNRDISYRNSRPFQKGKEGEWRFLRQK